MRFCILPFPHIRGIRSEPLEGLHLVRSSLPSIDELVDPMRHVEKHDQLSKDPPEEQVLAVSSRVRPVKLGVERRLTGMTAKGPWAISSCAR